MPACFASLARVCSPGDGLQELPGPTDSGSNQLRCNGEVPWCRAGLNLFQIDSQAVGGEYAAPLLLGISKRSLLGGRASTPAYAAYTGWHADTTFSLVPSRTQVPRLHTATCAVCLRTDKEVPWRPGHRAAADGLASHATHRVVQHAALSNSLSKHCEEFNGPDSSYWVLLALSHCNRRRVASTPPVWEALLM